MQTSTMFYVRWWVSTVSLFQPNSQLLHPVLWGRSGSPTSTTFFPQTSELAPHQRFTYPSCV
eukprot:TRINITY_DN3214_c0_g1_i1.p2 TRINITY_DN3214_c0_g1~~TRINITY_DN3214_c0_g1_i1.p2  ORF type:complete len:62 (-),score=5.34 TRINITY_DN3214_c0_g1_i1:98-283(-)